MEVGSAANSYEILAKLAEGGMAEIFLARANSTAAVERLVVLKRILPECAADVEVVQMFLEEARLASQLQHANVAQVYDVGKLGGSYFFTMEYIHGETLREVIVHAKKKRIKVPVETVLTIAAGAAAGLQHAHERKGIRGRPLGIVHSDVSPSNLVISRDGVVKIVDFGIAKASNRVETSTGAVRGKIAYLSPEQVHSEPLDRRSDLFSLGIVLWELLSLKGLYRRDSDYETMLAIETEAATPPSNTRDDVPDELDALVLKLLAKEPKDRYQTAAEVLDAVEAIAVKLGILLSAASLARTMKEWFGVRPEPWIEASTGGSMKRLVVNSEPIPDKLTETRKDPIDEKLRSARAATSPIERELADDGPNQRRESLDQIRKRIHGELKRRKTEAEAEAAAAVPEHAPLPEAPRRGWVIPAVVLALLVIGGGVAAMVVLDARTPAVAASHDAAIQIATAPVDAGAPPVDAGELTDASVPVDAGVRVKRRPTPTGDTIEAAYKDSDYKSALAMCLGMKLSASRKELCIVSACAVKDETHAKKWLVTLPRRARQSVLGKCSYLGVNLRPPADGVAKCADDPDACID